MAKVNLNAIRTGNATTDRLISAGQAIASNPSAAPNIISNAAQNILRGRAGVTPRTGLENLSKSPKQRGALSSLSRGRVVENFMFPDDLDSQHYMLFKAKERRRLTRGDKSLINDARVIALPIPGNLQISYAADYENASLGVAGAMIGGQMNLKELKSGLYKR